MNQGEPVDVKRHYLPAASIAYFGFGEPPQRLRKRPLWVLRKSGGTPYQTAAERVAFEKGIYGYGKGSPLDLDYYFKPAESLAHQPVSTLMQGTPGEADARAWVDVVWYISILFARGIDLEHKISHLPKTGNFSLERMGAGYPFIAQRISAAVLRARWQLAWSLDQNFILGDRGVTGTYFPKWASTGYFVPLRHNFGVMLGAAPFKKQLKWSGDSWKIEIDSVELSAGQADRINRVTWHAARNEVYGGNADQLTRVREAAGTVRHPIVEIAPRYENAQLLGLTPQERMKDELLSLKVGGLKKPGNDGPFFWTV